MKILGLSRALSSPSLATLLFFFAPTVSAESISVQCGASEGYSYYFAGGLVPESKAGFTEDSISNGKVTLLLTDSGEGDILFVDATGQLNSATAQGAKVLFLNASKGMNWLLLHPDGTIENYALNLATMKVAGWRNTVGNENVAKNSLLISDCVIR